MVTKKDLVIAILCTFCLTASLFTVLPTSSSPDAGDYDPWLDYNDDGIIDIRDISASARAFGAEGDSTKNVNVTNWAHNCYEWYSHFYISQKSEWHFYNTTLGYGQAKISIETNATVRVMVYTSMSSVPDNFFLGGEDPQDYTLMSKTYPVQSDGIWVHIKTFNSSASVWFTISMTTAVSSIEETAAYYYENIWCPQLYPGEYISYYYPTTGYRQVTIHYINPYSDFQISVKFIHGNWLTGFEVDKFIVYGEGSIHKTYPVVGSSVHITIENVGTGVTSPMLSIYVTA